MLHACCQGGCNREKFQSNIDGLRRLDDATLRVTLLSREEPSLVRDFLSPTVAGGSASYQKGDVLKSGKESAGGDDSRRESGRLLANLGYIPLLIEGRSPCHCRRGEVPRQAVGHSRALVIGEVLRRGRGCKVREVLRRGKGC